MQTEPQKQHSTQEESSSIRHGGKVLMYCTHLLVPIIIRARRQHVQCSTTRNSVDMYMLCCTYMYVHTVHMYCTHRLIHVHTVYCNVYVMFILTILHNVCHVYVCLLYSTYSMCNTTYTHILAIQYLQHSTARHGTYTARQATQNMIVIVPISQYCITP